MNEHDELDRAMPLVVEFQSFDVSYGQVTVEVTLPEAGDLELSFSVGDAAERELLQLIGRLVNDHLRELGAREMIIVSREEPATDDWGADD
jgi:hypothetical protein